MYKRQIPDGLRSYTKSAPNGDEVTAEFIWYDNASGMVELDYASPEPFAWAPSQPIPGTASVVSLKWMTYGKYHTGGANTEIKIQLPDAVRRWQRFDLNLPISKRQIYPTLSDMDCERSLMNPSEIAITYFSNPLLVTLRESDPEFKGQLTILGLTESTATIELHLPQLDVYGVDGQSQVFKLERRPKDAE